MKAALAWTGAALALHAAPAALAASAGNRVVGVRKRLRDERRVALTFDDGPQSDSLDRFLGLLAREGVHATFFLVGEQIAGDPALAREVRDAGHELANHGFAHRNHLLRAPHAVVADIERGAFTIGEATGVHPTMHRPPYGVVAAATCLGAARAGNRLVLWSRWGRDWRRAATPASIAREAAAHVRGGDIVLLHDADRYAVPGSWRNTLAALPRIIDAIRARDLQPTPIGGPASLLR